MPYAVATGDQLASHLQGEAATNRGVVSTRLQSLPNNQGRRVALWVSVGAVMAAIGAGTALMLFGSHRGGTTDPVSSAAAPSPRPQATRAARSSEPATTEQPDVPPDPSEEVVIPTASASATSRAAAVPTLAAPPIPAGSTGRGTAPVPPGPVPLDKPIDDIRSPFD